ncbi:hypothetical protein HPB49_010637 [Dermacentor silvarum]|uniref:Uncharacterized protein n=1 Tax=Dermacentor silvarum TaxID=543639 RepID=A0ACB8D4S8_DERSI|nr:hypothetical protein HPB49_010637 [Dermacentor silvarum]
MAALPKGPRVSAAQTTPLVEFMEQHPYLARGATSLSPNMSAAHKKALWNELTAALNVLGPAVKTARRWRQKTGGGRLGGLEGRVMDALSRTGPGYAPVDFYADDAEQASSSEEEAAATRVPLPTAPPQVCVGTEPGASGTAQLFTTSVDSKRYLPYRRPTGAAPPAASQGARIQAGTDEHSAMTSQGVTPGQKRQLRQPRRPPRQQQPLEDAACRAAAEYARQGQLAEAANVEAVTFHQMLLEQNRQHHQLVEELRASRVVQQQLAVETRGLREATALIAATLRQLLAALAHGLREPPQP